MKTTVFIIIVLFPFIVSSQSIPVHTNLQLKKINAHQYHLQFNFTIEAGWHVYARGDSSLALDPLTISLIDENSHLINAGKDFSSAAIIYDTIFNKRLQVFENKFSIRRILFIDAVSIPSVSIVIKGFASDNKTFVPIEITKKIKLIPAGTSGLLIPSINTQSPVSNCGDAHMTSSKGLLAIFLLGFGGGLLALLTPCVFPMVPLTISYFTSQSSKNASTVKAGIIYGACIVMIYLVASLPFHLMGSMDPQLLNSISTNAWLNTFFFVILVVFALSFFGCFNITLPSFLCGIASRKSNLGSAVGIFWMALTLCFVSFSCTGPILGSLLVGALHSNNGAWALTAAMTGFGLALGLAFSLFALFPCWLTGLPKSGSWMEVLKKSLAFVELALALKFLSNADLVEHWGLLKREVFVGLWILIFLGLSLYLLGVFEKRHFNYGHVLTEASDRRRKGFAKTRYVFGALSFLFVCYLTPGLTQSRYAGLRLVSGFPPPRSYSIYNNDERSGMEGSAIKVINDYQRALALAQKQNKPLLIEFTGWACINCRKMEENVWTDARIKALIEQNFILLSLYVDDRKELKPAEQFSCTTSIGQVKEVITIGDKNALFQAQNFQQVTQPMYAIVSPDQKLMDRPIGYTPDVNTYKQWLECGYNAFHDYVKQ